MTRRGRAREPLDIPIRPILEHYGFDCDRTQGYGPWFKIRCAFHGETRPSATVNFEIGRFQCFVGCTDRPEDAVGLVMLRECSDFLTAKREAESIAGCSSKPVRGRPAPRKRLLDESWD